MITAKHLGQARRQAGAVTDPVLLVAGPNVPPAVVMRHCAAALSAGRPLELLRLGDVTAVERRLLRALERRYGQDSVRTVETHSDWLALPFERMLVVLSDNGLWRGDDRVADHDEMLAMADAALSRLYEGISSGSR